MIKIEIGDCNHEMPHEEFYRGEKGTFEVHAIKNHFKNIPWGPKIVKVSYRMRHKKWYDTLHDSVEFVIHQFLKILSHYQCVRLSYVYPFVCLCLINMSKFERLWYFRTPIGGKYKLISC